MATNQTEHYGLSQWEPEDSFLREEFNQDHRKIDGALAAKCEVVFGCYIGDGTSSQVVPLGFTPRAVLVVGEKGVFTESGYNYGGMAMAAGATTGPGTNSSRIRVVEGGFQVYFSSGNASLNSSGYHYYIAFR